MNNVPLIVALAQVEGSPVPAENLALANQMVAEAAAGKADLIVFPEMFMALPEQGRSLDKVAEPLDGPFGHSLAELARQHALHIVSGFWEKVPDDHRVYNTALILSPEGKLLDCYRKVHLFDALSIRESDRMIPGNALPPLFTIKGVRVGLAICYDLRFPELFRNLALRGAELILLPSAWYAGPLKEEHWLTLLKARAIENTVYMAGANLTCGAFSGRSAIFDSFGVLIAGAGESPGLVIGRIDIDRIKEVRAKLPVLEHCRLDLFSHGGDRQNCRGRD
jgi:deaminated glutathione amidase